MSAPLLKVPERHREHDRKGQPYAQLHLVHATDEVALEAKAVVDTVVDSFQCGAPVVAPMPARAAMGRRHEDAAIVLGDLDANDPPIGTGIDLGCGVAGLSARAHTTDVRRRATVLQRVSIGFETLKD